MFASVSLRWISQSLTAWASNLFVFEQSFVSAVVSVATAASLVVVVVVVVVTVFVVVSAAAEGAGRGGTAAPWRDSSGTAGSGASAAAAGQLEAGAVLKTIKDVCSYRGPYPSTPFRKLLKKGSSKGFPEGGPSWYWLWCPWPGPSICLAENIIVATENICRCTCGAGGPGAGWCGCRPPGLGRGRPRSQRRAARRS